MTDPTKKPRRSRSEPTRAGAIHYLVHRSGEAWAVTSGGDNRASRLYESKAEAVEAAKAAVRVKGGLLQVQGRASRFRDSYTIGRDPFARIGAVEGIAPSAEAKRRTAEFDRKGLSSEERRRAIIEAYRPKG